MPLARRDWGALSHGNLASEPSSMSYVLTSVNAKMQFVPRQIVG